MTARTILTAAEMGAAEGACIGAGISVETLMDRAGKAAAEAIWRYAGPIPALVLCGPGNNGGDGYVIARALKDRGMDVRVAALSEPRSAAAKSAHAQWGGMVEQFAQASGAPLLVDALFGTGLARPLEEKVARQLMRLAGEAAIRVAIDLPSGVATNDGQILSPVPDYDLTVTFAALKPSHLLQPAAARMGRIVVADIGVAATSSLAEVGRPRLPTPDERSHKYNRGYVAVLAGEMADAGALAAAAALRAGAGYVKLVSAQGPAAVPQAVVQAAGDPLMHINDSRIGALVVGPGLGLGSRAGELLRQALSSAHPLVLDADALTLIGDAGVERLAGLVERPILTPHAGEFIRLFGTIGGSKVEQAREAARRSSCVVLFKGADTVVADPDGRAAISGRASPWLSTAGTGDVLAGIIAAMRARGLSAFDSACAGTWLHARAADHAGAGLIADDLMNALPAALQECL